MRVKLTNLTIAVAPALTITADVELLEGRLVPTTPPPPGTDPPPAPTLPLPPGFDSNPGVARAMLFHAMDEAGLTAVGVQRHGDQIVAALKRTYPDLDVYLSPSDAPVWPGFGSVDVTIDSGKGGFAFQVDAPSKRGRVAWVPQAQR